ncbi:DUF6138 family protein [Brevibacillus formosus]|uniref:Uncharacterized protein n=1 Tax=Brevibacillus formosus TaxID=54913 RepID=A0A837KP18_9BACL|nr:DUF6138 family protein [Brevibacillus formosus]KLH99397.1 hypothetical protein AA984_12950 [Brevibacillus formosus]MED1956816.1 DUF6138 family protein [Brevibacillus formosus]PSJ92955.1 hypothetical protein C7R91_21790 [Brevibacillus formosus]GED57213.1 hypothetical protein BFO01nite_13450 [Brevibacillus formosus]
MNELQKEALEEMKTAIHKWFDEQETRKNAGEVVLRTTLQVGIFNFVQLDYRPGRTRVETSKSAGSAAGKKSMKASPFTREQILYEVQPLLVEIVRERLDKLETSPLINYRFTFQGTFATVDGLVELTVLETEYEEKKRQLLERIQSYIEEKLEKGSNPTNRLETFFLARHLLDPHLFPEPEAAKTIALFDRIQELNKGQVEALAEHRRDIIWALTDWVENVFLPRYYDVTRSEYRNNEYMIKPDAVLENKDEPNQPIDLLLYGAVMIIRYGPDFNKNMGQTFLELAKQLGSGKAARMLKEGSDSFSQEDVHLRHELVECKANDVFSLFTIVIRKEEAGAYERAISFILSLLRKDFPKSYKIKLKSSVKEYLPIKGLAKSDTHRFFANALAYSELHPLLEEYAREAMEEYEWYEDTDSERSVMPGSYAVFGLGLSAERYFPLVEAYMDLVDDEHQLVHDKFTAVFAETYGITERSTPTLIACLLRSHDSLKLKIQPELESDDKLSLFVQQIETLSDDEVERVLYPIWGKVEKLAALARKAQGPRKELIIRLQKAAGIA